MNDEYSVMLHQLQGILSLIEKEHHDLWQKLLGIGIAIPGVVNAHTGQVKNHGNERRSWCGQPLGEEISRFTGLDTVLENNATTYDCICTSDYMIEKMISNDMIAELNYANIPEIKNIGDIYLEKTETFDPGHAHSVPYQCGIAGTLGKYVLRTGL